MAVKDCRVVHRIVKECRGLAVKDGIGPDRQSGIGRESLGDVRYVVDGQSWSVWDGLGSVRHVLFRRGMENL